MTRWTFVNLVGSDRLIAKVFETTLLASIGAPALVLHRLGDPNCDISSSNDLALLAGYEPG